MWPELTIIYLISLKVKGYTTGDPVGGGAYGPVISELIKRPPRYLTGKPITPESIREVALYRIKERVHHENYKRLVQDIF